MKSLEKNNYEAIERAFDTFFNEEIYDFEIDAKVMASRCLNEIKDIAEARRINRKELAKLIGTSPSYLTQLYRGNKLMNLVTLAKFKKALDLDVQIAISNNCYNMEVLSVKDDYRKFHLPNSNINWEIIKNISSNEVGLIDENFVNSSSKINTKKVTA